MSRTNGCGGNYPKVGIRPVIDGRRRGVRESLEEQTMNMAKNAAEWRTFLGEKREPGPTGGGLGNHYENFVNAIRDPRPETFNRSIEEGFHSCALIHLGNISYRLGRSLEFDPVTMTFPRDPEANAMLTREYRAPFVVPEKV